MHLKNQMVTLFCPCGKSQWFTLADSEHHCHHCDTWLIYRKGLLVKSIPISGKRAGSYINL